MPPSAAASATIQAATEGPPVSGTCCAPAMEDAVALDEADAVEVADAEAVVEAVAEAEEEPNSAVSIASWMWVFS